jgi:hypothetical protein
MSYVGPIFSIFLSASCISATGANFFPLSGSLPDLIIDYMLESEINTKCASDFFVLWPDTGVPECAPARRMLQFLFKEKGVNIDDRDAILRTQISVYSRLVGHIKALQAR